jgi:NifU homolog involved in Fe-S cluster formation
VTGDLCFVCTTNPISQCLPPVKLHCSMLAEDAIKSAINNYYKKNPEARPTNLAGRGNNKLETASQSTQ